MTGIDVKAIKNEDLLSKLSIELDSATRGHANFVLPLKREIQYRLSTLTEKDKQIEDLKEEIEHYKSLFIDEN